MEKIKTYTGPYLHQKILKKKECQLRAQVSDGDKILPCCPAIQGSPGSPTVACFEGRHFTCGKDTACATASMQNAYREKELKLRLATYHSTQIKPMNSKGLKKPKSQKKPTQNTEM